MLWLLLAGMVCILVLFVPVEPRSRLNLSLTTFFMNELEKHRCFNYAPS
ncbi:hypothetical protein [Vulcanisaeta sp. EB80]|nr:hypothetical protein [Vulcanisaeta sp. EB80]